MNTISQHGIWLFVKDTEYFLPFEKFPWFRDAKVRDIMEVEIFNDHYLRWEHLDVDLELESLENSEKYPLLYKYCESDR